MPADDNSIAGGVEAHNTGQGKFQVEILAAGATLISDQPVEAGGLGSGPTPHELLSSALAACTTMTLKLYADRKGWPLGLVTVQVRHSRDEVAGRDLFIRQIAMDGPLEDDQRQRLLEIAGRCPVHLTLERGSVITTTLAERPS